MKKRNFLATGAFTIVLALSIGCTSDGVSSLGGTYNPSDGPNNNPGDGPGNYYCVWHYDEDCTPWQLQFREACYEVDGVVLDYCPAGYELWY